MKRIVMSLVLSLTICLFAVSLQAQDIFVRVAEIPAEALDTGGFGNIVPGVDFDGDGLLEMYVVNQDWFDEPGKDLVPRIYKYEEGGLTGWQIVWSTSLDFFFQNTWPALEYADLDNDGKMEIVWGPVNNFAGGTNPNPARIVVFETVGDGSDNMGIDNGDGTWRPNAFNVIETVDNTDNRPFRFIITDIDSDGTDEIVSVSRAGDERGQIFSVDNIPDNGDSSEVWTMEFSGTGPNTHYDGVVIDSTAYFIRSGGDVDQVTWNGAAYVEGALLTQAIPNGSWKSATVVDIDGDGTKEILVASWNSGTSAVYLVQQSGDTLKTTLVMDVPDAANRLYGGAAGDVDGDGNLDFIFGTRQATPNALILRLEHQGGAIDDPANWVLSSIDSLVHDNASQYDQIFVANMDDDPEDEIIYTGTARGALSGDVQPIVILDFVGIVSVDEDAFTPSDFTLHQNYPNPFNPDTRIAYDLEKQTDVSLRVFNLRGQMVRNLVNETQTSGSYTAVWNGRNDAGISVPSGVYFYAFKAGDYTQTRRMTLLK